QNLSVYPWGSANPVPAQTTVPIVLTPRSPEVGGDVSLAPQNLPQDVLVCSWYRSATTHESSRILTYYPPPAPDQIPGPAHTGRETAGPGCTLHIAGLTLSDTGNYTVLIQTRLGHVGTCPQTQALPTVTPDQTQVLENGTFTLTCNSSPSADTVLWLRDGASLAPSERLGLSPENRTLMVPNVTRGDAGTYQCEVGNPVSSVRSEPSTVMGPLADSARIDLPGPIALTLRSPLNLTCVSDSVPAPSYRWVLNGTDTNETRIILTFNPTTWAQQGTYKCRAHNPITNRTAWGSVAVWVTGRGNSPAPRESQDSWVLSLALGGEWGLVVRTPKKNGAPVLVYENLPLTAWAGPVVSDKGSAPPPAIPVPPPPLRVPLVLCRQNYTGSFRGARQRCHIYYDNNLIYCGV
uniref:Ig-like domain-containing protein n=1 Tax=Terrapene triunguis TaxID=2587831 RepID=A0A674J6X5_9SAUR